MPRATFPNKVKVISKVLCYIIYYIISSTASAGQSGGYERPKCNGSYLGITLVMRWSKRNNHSEPRGNNKKQRKMSYDVCKVA